MASFLQLHTYTVGKVCTICWDNSAPKQRWIQRLSNLVMALCNQMNRFYAISPDFLQKYFLLSPGCSSPKNICLKPASDPRRYAINTFEEEKSNRGPSWWDRPHLVTAGSIPDWHTQWRHAGLPNVLLQTRLRPITSQRESKRRVYGSGTAAL